MRRLALGVFTLSELISPRLEILSADPGPADLEDRTKRALLSLRISGAMDDWRPPNAYPGLELAYRIGEDSEPMISVRSHSFKEQFLYLP
jgi:hypothetical protein